MVWKNLFDIKIDMIFYLYFSGQLLLLLLYKNTKNIRKKPNCQIDLKKVK